MPAAITLRVCAEFILTLEGAPERRSTLGQYGKAAEYTIKPVMLVTGNDGSRRPQMIELVGKLVSKQLMPPV